MNDSVISFNDLPLVVAEINRKIDKLLLLENEPIKPQDRLMTIEELQMYLPEHPARPTVYGWVNNRLIPYEKHGKRLYFRLSAVDDWLSNGRRL
jgi:hypothetical protein